MGHQDTTERVWSSTFVLAFPLDVYGRVPVVRSMFIPCALHGVESSFMSRGSFLKLRVAIVRVVWSRKQPLANAGAVLGLLDEPQGCDSSFCVVWFMFRLFRRYLSYKPERRCTGSTGFLVWCRKAFLVMALFMLGLLVSGESAFAGILLWLGGKGRVSLV